MFTYRGKTALITGASSGIGEVFAQRLAAQGTNLVLVARSEDKLQRLATQLQQQHGIQVDVIAIDLSCADAAQYLSDEIRQHGLAVDMLINNAGFGTYGQFDELPLERQRDEVLLNVLAVVELTHRFLPAMVAKGDGAVINVASTAAFQPIPSMAVYGATKAFVLSFSEALWAEYRERGVRVLALCPGPTETPFFDTVGSREPAIGTMITPEHVVQTGLQALEQGKSYAIPGWRNALTVLLPRGLPRSWTTLFVKWLFTSRKGQTGAVDTQTMSR